MIKLNKKGFSLLELILVLGIGTLITFMKFQDMVNEQDNLTAKTAGQQLNEIGQAVNGYINIRYDKLSTLTSSSNQSNDPGPRTCNSTGCEITYTTLINEGLLPNTSNLTNIYKSPYRILLRRDGTAPNYVINGLITTSAAWIEGGNIRYDLLGKSMQSAGIDSGVTKNSNSVTGFQGQWSAPATSYNNITRDGLLAFRVGFNSALYSVYLRRDGTLPMTGDLNMGGQSIYNAHNITATGATTTGSLKTNAGAAVGTTLNVAGVTTLGSDLNVVGNSQVNGNLNSNNTVSGTTVTSRGETYTQNWFRTLGDGGIYFQKYGGGWNMTDANTITAYGGKNVQTAAGLYGGYIKSSGNMDVNGNANIGTINSNNIHSNGNMDAAGQIVAGSLVSNGRTTVGEFIQVNGTASAGAGCSPNGLIGKNSSGSILSCVNGVWASASGTAKRLFIMVNGTCLIPNPDTGICGCKGSSGQYAYLSGISVGTSSDTICSGGQNDHCTTKTNVIYACSS